jgi:hypothetical protein
VAQAYGGAGTAGDGRGVSITVSNGSEAIEDARPVHLILIEQSGAKREIPKASAADGITEAEQVIHRQGGHLREIKVVSRHRAIARWKAGELGWRRVA